jgi:hypothetical protein
MRSHLKFAFLLAAISSVGLAVQAQIEGPVPTQTLVNVDSKSTPPANAAAITVSVNDHKQPLTAWSPVVPANAQVALLIDNGLRESVGREIGNLRDFVKKLPPGVEILVGYMQYGHVVAEQPFTSDHERATSAIHLPDGIAGMSASPYLCLSDFVKKWPGSVPMSAGIDSVVPAPHKARFVLMLSNGVDPYNGSTSIMNQDSPYVAAAIKDAQRAGVAVYSIYFGAAGMGGGSANFSGQSYLTELTEGTGGVNYYQGTGNPVSMAPFLGMFQNAIAETYIATFNAPASGNRDRDLVRVKITAPNAKLRAPEEVRVGNQE